MTCEPWSPTSAGTLRRLTGFPRTVSTIERPMHHPLVEFRDVSFTYGEGTVLDGVSLRIPEGAFIGVVGPSGAGKTTLLKLMAGALRPATGEILFGPDGRSTKIRLGIVPQLEAIDWNFPVTVEEVVLLGRAADARLLPWSSPARRSEAREILS